MNPFLYPLRRFTYRTDHVRAFNVHRVIAYTSYQPTPHNIPEARRPSYILLTTLFSNNLLWTLCESLTLNTYFLSFSVTLIGGVVFLLFAITALFFDPNAEWRLRLTCHLLKLSNVVTGSLGERLIIHQWITWTFYSFCKKSRMLAS